MIKTIFLFFGIVALIEILMLVAAGIVDYFINKDEEQGAKWF